MPDNSSKISLIVGLALPALMVAIIAGLVFLPSKLLDPTVDFIYVAGPYPSYTTRSGDIVTQHDLSIKDGKLTDTTTSYESRDAYPPIYPQDKSFTPRFFIHYTTSNTNEEIPYDKVRTLSLSPDRKSPEGFSLTFGKQSYGVFPFFFDNPSSDDRAYLSADRGSKEITLISDTSINRYDLQLVGWVLQN